MLHTIRKLRKSLLGLALVILIAVTMLPFGSGLSKSLQGESKAAIKVGEKEYSFADYRKKLDDMKQAVRARLGNNAAKFMSMMNLEQRAIDEIINAQLLQQFSDSLGFTADKAQIEASIASSPYFGGKVTQDAYENFLRVQGITGLQLEDQVRQNIVASQIQTLLADLNVPSEAELKQIWADDKRKLSFRYLAFSAKDFEAKVPAPSEEALKTFFSEHASSYRKPKSVAFTAVPFNPNDYLSKVEVLEDDLQSAYSSRLNSFTLPAQVHLRRILIKQADSANPSELENMLNLDKNKDNAKQPATADTAKAKLEKVMAELAGDKSFSDIASAYSDDPEGAKNGGDLGWKKYTELDTATRNAVSKLAAGEHSSALDTAEGKVILYVKEKKEKQIKPFEEVRQELETELRKADAPQYAQNGAEAFLKKWEDQRKNSEISLNDYAKQQQKTTINTPGLISRENSSADIPAALIEKTLGISQGEHEIISAGDTPYLIEVTGAKEAYIPELSEVKEQVITAYRQEQAKILARKSAEAAVKELLEAVKTGNDKLSAATAGIDKLASANGIKVGSTEPAVRSSAQAVFLNSAQDITNAYALNVEQPVAGTPFEGAAVYYAVTLASSSAPDQGDFEKQKSELKQREMQQGGSRLLETILQAMKAREEVFVNPELLNRKGS